MTACLGDGTIAAYVDGALDRDEVMRVDRHIDGCATCRTQLSTVAATPQLHSFVGAGAVASVSETGRRAIADGRAGDPVPDTVLGRYVVDSVIGRGGMSVVVRARDPEPDRDIAIKLVAPAEQHGAWRARLRAEARAMARLRHPNVVAVYDVGA